MKVVSKKIRNSARGQECSLRLPGVCSFDNETTVLAHIGRSRGVGFKCHDTFSVYACYKCHQKIDTESKDKNAVDLLRALEETQVKLIEQGLIEVAK